MAEWFVYDPDPMSENGPGPILWGPKIGSWTEREAEDYANLLHEEDESGNTVVIALTRIA